MAGVPVFFASDHLERSVWVVVDPRDTVTGTRVSAPLKVTLDGVTAQPIVGRSGVYCFIDLNVPPANYTVRVQPLFEARHHYFAGAQTFLLATVPNPAQPLNRNFVSIDLLPRPAYPIAAQTTLARGRLVKASDKTPLDGASIALILDGVDRGLLGRTDERGEFVIAFPPEAPEDTPTAGLEDLKFELRFEVEGEPSFVIAEETVREGSAFSLDDVEFPGT
jgi:hypothetical protein